MTALEQLTGLIESWTGICMTRGGADGSLRRFAGARVKELGLSSIDAYVKQLAGPPCAERDLLVNAVTVNYTWFYRDGEQLEAVGRLLRDAWPTGTALNLWVPGCATGEDAYALAMLAERVGRPVSVLGTDINSTSLAWAREGRYGTWSMRDLPDALKPGFTAAGKGALQVGDDVKRAVRFEPHNLVEPPKRPMGAGWDLVLCRNVLIYFSREGTQAAHERLGASLSPGGWLVLGANESVWQEPPGLKQARLAGRPALYRPLASGRLPAGLEPDFRETPAAASPPTVVGPGSEPVAASRPVAARRAPTAVALVAEGAALMSSSLADAISPLMRARELDPLSVEAHLHLGIAFHLSGDALSAAPSLRSALLLEPTLWPAAFYLALTYENLGQPAEAQREYRRVVDQSHRPLVLEVRGVLGDLESWKIDVLALARRRSKGASPS